MEEANDDVPTLQNELTLLNAIFPEELLFDTHNQEVIYTNSSNATLKLRLPSGYPASDALPDLIFAAGPAPQKLDLRNQYRQALKEAQLTHGEPVLDAMISIFNQLLESLADYEQDGSRNPDSPRAFNAKDASNQTGANSLTVVIWLHHLLATAKRKQALDPPKSTHGTVSGITKPGYPGLMIFSGPAAEVEEHVQALKGMNWQAFQVRYEEAVRWEFKHGDGMKEVETMGEVVEEIGEGRKEAFMEAMRMK